MSTLPFISDSAFPQLCLHEWIQAQARLTPEADAVVFEESRLTYRELNRRANQVARELRARGAGPEKRVALCVERSLEVVVGLLGILKAGAAYVPLDPALPVERLTYMATDSQAILVVTQQRLASRLPALPSLFVDTIPWGGDDLDDDPVSGVTPENLAYLIYTSGSTGQPKGVEIEHRQIVHYVAAILERMEFPAGCSFATVSTIAADLGNTMLFPSLCSGGCLHVVALERIMDGGALAAYFDRHQIDCLKIVPSHLAALMSGPDPQRLMPRRRLILGGESARCDWVAGLQRLAPDCVIFNHYGPTETTVGVLTFRVGTTPPETPSGTLPLGRPLPRIEAHILDADRRPVAPGEVGELYLGGAGVARGYHERPELTAERFVTNPFRNESGARLYRTGDQARSLPDGNIEFLGRIDQQVKIDGYRIELGEIEAALGGVPGVRQAAVLAREDRLGDKRLVAYIVLTEPTGPTAEVLRDQLRTKLPEYMLPTSFVVLRSLPLTANGKVDRRALPAPVAGRPYVGPRTALEQMVAGVWQQELGMKQVGLEDNFFELGGTSLRLARVHGALRGLLRRELSIAKLFEYPTIRALAAFLDQPAAARPAGRLQRVAARAQQMMGGML